MNLARINTQIWFDSNQYRGELDMQSTKLSTGGDNSMSSWGGMQRFYDVIFFVLSAYLPLWVSGISIFDSSYISLSV